MPADANPTRLSKRSQAVPLHILCLNLLLRMWLYISGGLNCCQKFRRGVVEIDRSKDRTRKRR